MWKKLRNFIDWIFAVKCEKCMLYFYTNSNSLIEKKYASRRNLTSKRQDGQVDRRYNERYSNYTWEEDYECSHCNHKYTVTKSSSSEPSHNDVNMKELVKKMNAEAEKNRG
jgi:hypothetical protein